MELEILSVLIICGGMIFGLFMGYLLYICKLKEYDDKMEKKIKLMDNNMLKYYTYEKDNELDV